MQIRTTMIILGACLFGAGPAMAEGYYVDGGYSATSLNGSFVTDPLDDPEFESIGARFGKNVTQYLSIEGEVLTGLTGKSRSYGFVTPVLGSDPEQISSIDYDVKSSLSFILGGYGRATVPVTSRLSIFGRLGYAAVELDQTTTTLETIIESDEDPFESLISDTSSKHGPAYGVGATFDVTDSIYIRGDFSRYDLDYYELDNIMLGAGIRF